MAHSTETKRLKTQRGLALSEALIALVLLGVIGLGLVYALGRGLVAQKYQKAQSLAVQSIRAEVQDKGLAAGCAPSGSSTVRQSNIMGDELYLGELRKDCSIGTVTVKVGALSAAVKLPSVSYQMQAETLLGPGTLIVKN